MQALNHILVPSDFSRYADNASMHAVMLARQYDAKITLLHVVTVHDEDPYNPAQNFPHIEEYYAHMEQSAGENLAASAKKDPLAGLNIERVILRGYSPSETICNYAEKHNVDLIAMGTHGRQALAHFFLGSVAEKVVHNAPCPVLTTKIKDDGGLNVVNSYKRLLVPIDFSEQSQQALDFAIQLMPNNGKLDIVHVIEAEIHPAYYAADETSLFDFMPHLQQQTTESLQKIAQERVPDHLETDFIVLEGSIARNLADYAEDNEVDAVVMGTHGNNALEQILVGSVANRLIRKAHCPVITVK